MSVHNSSCSLLHTLCSGFCPQHPSQLVLHPVLRTSLLLVIVGPLLSSSHQPSWQDSLVLGSLPTRGFHPSSPVTPSVIPAVFFLLQLILLQSLPAPLTCYHSSSPLVTVMASRLHLRPRDLLEFLIWPSDFLPGHPTGLLNQQGSKGIITFPWTPSFHLGPKVLKPTGGLPMVPPATPLILPID